MNNSSDIIHIVNIVTINIVTTLFKYLRTNCFGMSVYTAHVHSEIL